MVHVHGRVGSPQSVQTLPASDLGTGPVTTAVPLGPQALTAAEDRQFYERLWCRAWDEQFRLGADRVTFTPGAWARHGYYLVSTVVRHPLVCRHESVVHWCQSASGKALGSTIMMWRRCQCRACLRCRATVRCVAEYAPFPYAPDDVTDAALDEAITFEAVRQSARFQVLHDAFVVRLQA